MARLSIDLSKELDETLNKLSEDGKLTKREVIRQALALFNYLHEQDVRQGGTRKLSITEKEGDKVIKDIVF